MRILILSALLSVNAFGFCRFENVCSGFGACVPMQVCENTFDVPTPAVAPIPQPFVTPVRPAYVPSVPPVGTTECGLVLVNGIYREVCQ